MSKYIWPVNLTKYPITSNFYDSRGAGIHMGTDQGTPKGVTGVAPADGRVQGIFSAADTGLCIAIDTPDGLRMRFMHLTRTLVSIGQEVKQGQECFVTGNSGTNGSTGLPYAPHIHHDYSYAYKEQALKVQPDPRLHLNRWRVDFEKLIKEEIPDMVVCKSKETGTIYVVGATGKITISNIQEAAGFLTATGQTDYRVLHQSELDAIRNVK